MKPRCGTCAFWCEVRAAKGDGECRKNPPSGGDTKWPETERDEWCGAWEHKDDAPLIYAAPRIGRED